MTTTFRLGLAATIAAERRARPRRPARSCRRRAAAAGPRGAAIRRCSRSPSPSKSPSDRAIVPIDVAGVADRLERHEDDAVRELVCGRRGDRLGEPRLADPAGAGDGEQPDVVPVEERGRLGEALRRARSASSSARSSDSPVTSSCRRSAIASAKLGSLISASTSCTSTFDRSTSSRSAEKSASSASASWSTCPSVESSERPRSGTNSTVGPVAAFSLRARTAASCAALLRRRPRRGQDVRRGVDRSAVRSARASAPAGRWTRRQSSPPSETTWGTPRRPAVSSRSGPAGQMPPVDLVGELRRGDVEHADDKAGLRSAASIDLPPCPIWWKTSTS